MRNSAVFVRFCKDLQLRPLICSAALVRTKTQAQTYPNSAIGLRMCRVAKTKRLARTFLPKQKTIFPIHRSHRSFFHTGLLSSFLETWHWSVKSVWGVMDTESFMQRPIGGLIFCQFNPRTFFLASESSCFPASTFCGILASDWNNTYLKFQVCVRCWILWKDFRQLKIKAHTVTQLQTWPKGHIFQERCHQIPKPCERRRSDMLIVYCSGPFFDALLGNIPFFDALLGIFLVACSS